MFIIIICIIILPILLLISCIDEETLAEITEWAKPVDEFKGQYVGTTNVLLDGHSDLCRRQECNLGNLVADAYIQQHLQVPNERHWNDVGIALMNAGGIRSTVQPGMRYNIMNIIQC